MHSTMREHWLNFKAKYLTKSLLDENGSQKGTGFLETFFEQWIFRSTSCTVIPMETTSTQCPSTHLVNTDKHRCGSPAGHDGAHRTYYSYIPNVTWPNATAPLFAKGGWEAHPAGKGSGKTTANWADIVDAEMDRIKNETHVLLTVEDLKTIAYYMAEEEDADPTKAKIDAALKKML